MNGSQMYQLMSLAGESLAGRAAILRMSGLSQHEIYGNSECLPFTVSFDALQKRVAYSKPCDILEQFERIWNGSLTRSYQWETWKSRCVLQQLYRLLHRPRHKRHGQFKG